MAIKHLLRALRYDRWRDANPFSAEVEKAHAVLHHPYASKNRMIEELTHFCAKRQPCVFGRTAAQKRSVFFSILTEDDIYEGDEAVAEKLAREQLIWKQQAIHLPPRPTPHSFVLVVASERVAFAAPDDRLYEFSCRIRDLARWSGTETGTSANAITSDFLYLRHPTDGTHLGFQFNVDFFAASADGRWWHDHRMPGGIAFTANSPGHMKQFQEWYSHAGTDRGENFVQQAMDTIAFAHQRAVLMPAEVGDADDPATSGEAESAPSSRYGPVTWLRDLEGGPPLKADSPCPFSKTIPSRLEGKDWTVYEGFLHTDHSVRREFFADDDAPPTLHRRYVMDLTYLYDRRESDNATFMRGVPVSADEIAERLGDPDSWGGLYPDLAPALDEAEDDYVPRVVREALAESRAWVAEPAAPESGDSDS